MALGGSETQRESEHVIVVRPLKLIAFICVCIAVLILGGALSTSHWLEGRGFHQGLWEYCYADGGTRIAAGTRNIGGGTEVCRSTTDRLWILGCGVLGAAALLSAVISCILTLVGLLISNRKRRPALYGYAAIAAILGVVFLLASLVIFPVMLLRDIESYRSKFNIVEWLFSWSYGLAWGAWLFLVGAAVLLLVRRSGSEKEERRHDKTYYTPANGNAARP